LSDNGAQFRVAVSNVIDGTLYSVLSSNAVLTVTADTTAPLLVGASGLALETLTVIDGVLVDFNEAVLPATATNLANYLLRGPGGAVVSLSSAMIEPGSRSVSLVATAPLAEGATYTVRVSNVRDASAAGNVIAPNSERTFVAAAFSPGTVGGGTVNVVRVPGGYDVTSSASGTGANADAFGFNSQLRSGDFDVQVRVEGIGLANGYSEAGLMARDGLSTNGAFAAVLASGGLSGVKFQSRSSPSAAAASVGSMPVNYPYTWLRLQRTGDVFRGFGSFDGQKLATAWGSRRSTWARRYTSGSSQARARRVSPVQPITAKVPRGRLCFWRRLCRRRGVAIRTARSEFTPDRLVISEIMYHPPDVPGVTNSLEYIEIFNGQDYFEDLERVSASWRRRLRFSGGDDIAKRWLSRHRAGPRGGAKRIWHFGSSRSVHQ
jgi:hypothetical protein